MYWSSPAASSTESSPSEPESRLHSEYSPSRLPRWKIWYPATSLSMISRAEPLVLAHLLEAPATSSELAATSSHTPNTYV